MSETVADANDSVYERVREPKRKVQFEPRSDDGFDASRPSRTAVGDG